jgi:hypothetical protein
VLQEGDIYASGSDGGRWQFNFYKRQHIKGPRPDYCCVPFVYIYIYINVHCADRVKGRERVAKPFIMLTAVHLLC